MPEPMAGGSVRQQPFQQLHVPDQVSIAEEHLAYPLPGSGA